MKLLPCDNVKFGLVCEIQDNVTTNVWVIL